ncbi:hypothetical protein GTA09_19355 [Rhodococcus hoagii]|nr:hypothetical protein [Prescottella equi]
MGDALAFDESLQVGAGVDRRGRADQGGAVGVSRQQFEHARVERRRGGLEHHCFRRDVEFPSLHVHECRESPVGDGDTLRDAGAARREEQVREAVTRRARGAVEQIATTLLGV